MVITDESPVPDKYFKIDQAKLKTAHKLVDDFESKIQDSAYNQNSVLKNVSMNEIFEDLRVMLNYPNSTVIGNTGHYCSVAVVLNWMLNNEPEKYAKAVLELAYFGVTRLGEKQHKLKVPGALRKKVDYSVIDTIDYKLIRKDIDATSISDFIFGVSIMYKIKQFQRVGLIQSKATCKKSTVGNFLFANTAPWELNNIIKKAGLKVEQQGFYLGDKEDLEQLLLIEQALRNGKMVTIFDNHWITYAHKRNGLYEFTGAHYSNLHSFKVDTINNIVDYSFWDYGVVKDNPYTSSTVKARLGRTVKKTIKLSKKFKQKQIPQKRSISTKEFLKALKGFWIISSD